MKQLLTTLGLIIIATTIRAAEPTAYVINSNGETLSRINLSTGNVDNDILTLGSDVQSFPNQIIIRDTMAYVINSGTNEIQLINLVVPETVGYLPTGAGSNPFWMAQFDSQYVYVSCLVTDQLLKVDLVNRLIAKTTTIGAAPEGVLIDDFKVYVALTAYDFGSYTWGVGKVAVYDTRGDTLMYEIEVGTNPQYLDRDSAGRIHVVCTGDYWLATGQVYLIDPELDEVIDSVAVGGSPGQIAITDEGIAYVAAGGWDTDGFIYTYNALTLERYHDAANPLLTDYGATMVVDYQGGNCLAGGFANIVRRIDSAGSSSGAFAVGSGPSHAALNYIPGDINGDWKVNISDITYYLNWLYGVPSGPAPIKPHWRADANAAGDTNISDITYLINYLFGVPLGPPPVAGPPWIR